MPRFSQTTLSLIATIGLSGTLSGSAFAAEINTYRPGHAYLKSAANSHEVCEQQCRGDAQCRGWNFVRPNPRAQTGICEFNERTAMPVRSPISISGEINTSVDPLMSRAIPAGSRTVRVGTPTIAKPKPTTKPTQRTTVNRMPVPARQPALQKSTHRTPAQQNTDRRQPRVYGQPNPAAVPKAAPAPATPQALTPQQQYYRQQFLIEQQKQEQLRAQQQAALRWQQQQFGPRPGMPQAGAPQYADPRMVQPPRQFQNTAPIPPAAPMSAPSGPTQTINGPMVKKSLYGSLHDDLTQNLTPVPRPQTAPDDMNNPDAPVSTSRAAPAGKVDTTPLAEPQGPALAGG